MAESSGNLRNFLEDWLDQNIPRGYTSCIKINGRPILPPLMSEERRVEMRRLRQIATEVESRVNFKKENVLQDDCAGGEAMYEGAVDELHFANSLPSSLVPSTEEVPQSAPILDMEGDHHTCIVQKQLPGPVHASDMLKEFDPLAREKSKKSISPLPMLELTTCDFPEKSSRCSEKNSSKPGSADSSIGFSCSTDLNNYMDITEGSVDASIEGSSKKSVGETGTNTPSTVRPDSADTHGKYLPGVPWREGRTTYEDLNNYLDSLLSNSSGSRKARSLKDNNQNMVTSSTSPPSSQSTVSPSSLSQNLKLISTDPPPPLTSPLGSLQTRIVADSKNLAPITCSNKNTERTENSADFLQSCALSPVRSDQQKSYEEKVQQYLQNLILNEGTMRRASCGSSSHNSQNLGLNFKEHLPDKNMVNDIATQFDPQGNVNGYGAVPPRLVRSNSYTLDSPSPMLLAHMEAELRKNVRNGPNLGEKVSQSAPARRVWDTDISKNMPSWCSRQSTSSTTNPKVQSPKKVLNRSVSAQPNPYIGFEEKQLDSVSVMKSPPSQPKKQLIVSNLKEGSDKVHKNNSHIVSSVSSDCESEDKVRSLLLQLQLQHNQEMEELVNRQRKEKEAIRIALLQELDSSATKPSEATRRPLTPQNTSSNHQKDLSCQSPPTKDKVLFMERRNTSPSLFDKENAGNSQNQLVLNRKSSSISLEDVPTYADSTALINLGFEDRPQVENRQSVTRTDLNILECSNIPSGLVKDYDGASDMISSFPPGDLPHSSQLENMTMSCRTQSSSLRINSPVAVCTTVASVAQSILSTALASGGSPRSKRRSWCSRQLFPEDAAQGHPDWVMQSQEVLKHRAAARIQAGVRGYLTRRLLKTERVQNCITTIRDTIVCALQLQQECAPNVEPSDLQLHGRLIQQLSAACEDLHYIFLGLSVKKRLAIIAADRERLRVRTPRSRSSTGSRPLSRATQIALQRKMNQNDPSDSCSVTSRSSSANRSRRRSWATVESRVRASIVSSTSGNNCEVVSGCLSRSSAPMSLPLQRSASAGSSRKPWR